MIAKIYGNIKYYSVKYFNHRNFHERNCRDFANFCHFCESLSCEIAIDLKFAKIYLAKFCEILYSLKFDLNFVIFSVKTALFAATLHSLTKVYLAKLLTRQSLPRTFRNFFPRESFSCESFYD